MLEVEKDWSKYPGWFDSLSTYQQAQIIGQNNVQTERAEKERLKREHQARQKKQRVPRGLTR